jgi:cytochrome c peroxidase
MIRQWLYILALYWVALLPLSLSTTALAERDVYSVRRGLNPPVTLVHAQPKLVELGNTLFFDKRLSENGTISCASCHQPQHAFSDALAKSQGINQQLSTRNVPSLFNVALNRTLFWDGRRDSLESQSLDPLTNPREHGFDNVDQVLQRLQSKPRYVRDFAAAFNRPENQTISTEEISKALSAFQRTLTATGSPFDEYHYGNRSTALTASQLRGLQLFEGAASCAQCHTIGNTSSTFTDEKFHTLSVGLQNITPKLSELTQRVVNLRQQKIPIDQIILGDEEISQLGRFVVTLDPTDIGKFRTPSLRNVQLTAPYMHDGSVATLQEAVDLEVYYRGAEQGRPLILTPAERADLVAFLESLTSPAAIAWSKFVPSDAAMTDDGKSATDASSQRDAVLSPK